MGTRFLIAIASLFALAAILIWVAFLRPVPVQTTTAVIKAKTHKPAGTYWQQQVGVNRGFRTAIPISVAESFVLELYSDELDSTGFYSVSPSEADAYPVGGRVAMEYKRRGLPLFGYKTTVYSVRPQ